MTTTKTLEHFEINNVKTGKAVSLKMQELWLGGRISPAGAHLAVRHTFTSSEKDSMEVVYAFPMPRDASLHQFRIVGEEFEVTSELKPLKEARETYEAGIEAGHLSSMTQNYRDGLVNLSVGNIRPGETVTVYLDMVTGVELRDNGYRFRFPFTLAPCYDPEARYVKTGTNSGEMEFPFEKVSDIILPVWSSSSDSLHRVGFSLNISASQAITEVASPSHPIRVNTQQDTFSKVDLAVGNDVPNRDLVLDIRTREQALKVVSGQDKNGKGRFAIHIPSTVFGEVNAQPRNIVFLLDRSGSMAGKPMDQAKAAIRACLAALSPEDKFNIVAFDYDLDYLFNELRPATEGQRATVDSFLEGIDARGGTELQKGIVHAAKFIQEGTGEIFILTDGQVMRGEEILEAASKLGHRLHCLGIGSASQDRFIALLSRETEGVSRFVTPRERVDMAALELFASVGHPVARNVQCALEGLQDGEIPITPPQVSFTDNPVLIHGSCSGTAEGKLLLSWENDLGVQEMDIPVRMNGDVIGEDLRLLQGARMITDLEAEWSEGYTAVDSRRTQRLKKRLEQLSLDYGLASRVASLVAIVKRKGDEEGAVPKTYVVPVGMPQDTAFSSYFQGSSGWCCEDKVRYNIASDDIRDMFCDGGEAFDIDNKRFEYSFRDGEKCELARPSEYETTEAGGFNDTNAKQLIELAAAILPDGGMPGDTLQERILTSTLALLAFDEHESESGAFSLHIRRLKGYLTGIELSVFSEVQKEFLEWALDQVEQGKAFQGKDVWLDEVTNLLERDCLVERVWGECISQFRTVVSG